MKNSNRREFLTNGLAAGALCSLSGLPPQFLAQAAAAVNDNSGENILVVVQLSGGNDGLNTVVPFKHPVYKSARPTLRVAESDALKLNDELGLHPSARGLADLWEDNQLCIVQGVGYEQPNRSHFESMDIWHSCLRKTKQRSRGWLGQFLDRNHVDDASADSAAIHLGREKLPFALVAEKAQPTSIQSIDRFRLDSGDDKNQVALLNKIGSTMRPRSSGLPDFVQSGTSSALQVSERIRAARKNHQTDVDYPENPLAEKLKIIAQLIDAKLSTRVYYVTLDGFDTHARQANGHSALLRRFASSVSAFIQDVGQRAHGDRVTLLAFSEFGRRVQENASKGTDHGTAAPVFLAGKRVRPGFVGDMPSLDDLKNGDLKFHTDFRRVYASLLENWLDCASQDILHGEYKPLDVFA